MVFNSWELKLLSQEYQKRYRPNRAQLLAGKLAESLDPLLEDTVLLWLQTGEEQPFDFEYGGAVYSLQGVQRLLNCSYLTALERMNDFVKDPEHNYYRIIPC